MTQALGGNTHQSNDSGPSFFESRYALMVFLGAVIISFSAVFVKASDIGPTACGFYRVFFAAIFLFFILLLQKKTVFFGGVNILFSVAAGVFFAGDLFSWHIAIRYIGPGLSTIIANFQVFFMAVLGLLLFKEMISLKIAIAVPSALFGLFLMVGVNWNDLGPQYHMGVIWSFAAAVAYSGYMVSLKMQQQRKDTISAQTSLLTVCIVTSIILGFTSVYQGESLRIPDMKNFIYMASLGGFCQVGGWVLITKGLARTRASITGLLLLIQPSLSFVWDILIFSRPTTMTDILGAGICLTAIYLGSASKKKRAKTLSHGK